MAQSIPERDEALNRLRDLVARLGTAHVVYLLVDIVDERRDRARVVGDAVGVSCAAHDARLLGETAMRLRE